MNGRENISYEKEITQTSLNVCDLVKRDAEDTFPESETKTCFRKQTEK